jgi:hypothetical protein
MEGGMAEQCWSGEKEAALVDVLQAVDKKNATVNDNHSWFT